MPLPRRGRGPQSRRIRAAPIAALVILALPIHARGQDAEPAATDESPSAGTAAEGTLPPEELERYEETSIVTASRVEQSLLETPVSVTVIPRDQIETTPALDFADLLRGVPGLNVIQLSPRDVNVTTRGATGVFAQGLLALVDGRPINEASNGIVLWDQLPVDLEEIEQIEVLRGPGSAVWGSNALRGVVNVRTRSPRALEGGYLSAGAGEDGTRLASFRVADAHDVFSWKVAASSYQADAWDRPTELADGTPVPAGYDYEPEGTKQLKADVRFDWDLPELRRWSLQLGHAGARGIVMGTLVPISFRSPSSVRNMALRYESSGLEARFSWMRVDHRTIAALGGTKAVSKNDAFSLDVVARRIVGERQLLVFGGAFEPVLFDNDAIPGHDSRMSAGVFLEDQAQIGTRAILNAGARLDWFETSGFALSPRVGLVVTPRSRHSLRAAWNRAYRAPTLVESWLEYPSGGAIILPSGPFFHPLTVRGNGDLDVVVSDGIEVGWTGILGPQRRHLASAALYRNVVEDSVSFFPSKFFTPANPPPGWPLPPDDVALYPLIEEFSYRNLAKVIDRGLELALDSTWREGVTTRVSWTVQDPTDVEDDDPLIPLQFNVPPRHQAAASLSVLRGRWSGSFGVTYTGSAQWNDVLDSRFWGPTPSYWLVQGRLGAKLPGDRLEIVVGATNLFDDAVQQHAFGDVVRRRATVELKARF